MDRFEEPHYRTVRQRAGNPLTAWGIFLRRLGSGVAGAQTERQGLVRAGEICLATRLHRPFLSLAMLYSELFRTGLRLRGRLGVGVGQRVVNVLPELVPEFPFRLRKLG